MTRFPSVARTLACVLVLAGLSFAGTKTAAKAKASSDKIPITTSSEEARQAYLTGRDLADTLRGGDAHAQYEKAVKLDPHFALGSRGLANTSGTTKEFIEATTHAAALAPKVREGE